MHISNLLIHKRLLEILTVLFRPLPPCSNVDTKASKEGRGVRKIPIQSLTQRLCREPKWNLILFFKLGKIG